MSRSHSSRRRLFAHREDRHGALFHLLVLAAYGVAFALHRNPEAIGVRDGWDFAAWVLGAAFLLGWVSGIDVGVNFHNHCHRPIFRSARANRWFERIWTVSGGWPAHWWRHAHVVVHHAALLGEEDWTLPRRRADGRFENLYRYVLGHWPWRYLPALWRDFRAQRGGVEHVRTAWREGAWFLALWSIPFWIDPLMGLCLWALPHWIGNAVIMGSGMYVQHAGCEPRSEDVPYRHSNSFASRFFNLTMFNIGYHVVHHDHANVHWSALPALHAKLLPRMEARGVHVVPYGYFRAASLCSSLGRTERGLERFLADRAPSDVRPARTPATIP